MPTASIYFHAASSEPAFVLIDGERSDVHAADYASAPNITGSRLRAVDHACRRIGWKVVDTAAIVRQADGYATIRVEPGPELQAAADAAVDRTVAEMSGPNSIAYVTVGPTGVPQAVAVDGTTKPVHTLCSLTSSLPANSLRARQAVHMALGVLGYETTGDVANRDGTWTVPVRADADWRDVPTMVRIDDDTARALNDMAERLGIPGDQLAADWIRREAADARSRYDRFMSPGYIADHARITGWLSDGSPRLKG